MSPRNAPDHTHTSIWVYEDEVPVDAFQLIRWEAAGKPVSFRYYIVEDAFYTNFVGKSQALPGLWQYARDYYAKTARERDP